MSITKEFIPSTGNLDGYVNHTAQVIWNADNWVFIGYNDSIDNDDCDAYYTFDNFTVPSGAIIEEAILKISVYAVNNGNVTTDFRIDLGNIDLITDYSDFSNLTLSENFVSFDFDTTNSEVFLYLDVTDIIQEKVDHENYIQGNNITFATSNTQIGVSNAYVDGDTYEYNLGNSITVTYTPQPVPDFRDTFYGNRVESFQYELLVLNTEQTDYIHSKWLTEDVISCSLTQNFDNDIVGSIVLTMKEDLDINYLSDLVKIYYTCNGYTFPLGCYMMLSPYRYSTQLIKRTIEGYDLLKYLEQNKISTSLTIPSGTVVTDEIISRLGNIGNWVKYNIKPSTEVLSEDMSYVAGKSELFIINSLLNTIDYVPLFCNGNGTYTSYPYNYDEKSNWTFYDNNQSLYTNSVDLNVDYSGIFNKAVVMSNELTEDTEPIVSECTFEDINLPDHPYSYTSLNRYIVQIFSSETVTQDYADLRSERELRKMLENEETINYSCAFISSRLDDGLFWNNDCFKFRNLNLDVEANYNFISFTWNLATGNLLRMVIRRTIKIE